VSQPVLPLDGVTGVVLAGGRASRFGADKLRIELGGRPLLHHAIEAVAAVASRVVVVAAPGRAPAIPEALGARVRVVHDPEPFGGPLVGLAAALAVVDTPVALVAGGDMPRMVAAVLCHLVVTAGPDRRAVVLDVPGRLQPLPAALDVVAARAGAAAALGRGRRSLRDLLLELAATSVPEPVWRSLDPTGATIADIDRPDDLPT
jgi:molybdopterin-guanine dinucleotide biosynthesis protein A